MERQASLERRRQRGRAWAKANYVPRVKKAVAPAKAPAVLPAAAPPVPVVAQPARAITAIPATPKQVRVWLAQNLYACGAERLAAEDRVALMTHQEALAEANRRRARLGDAPLRLVLVRAGA